MTQATSPCSWTDHKGSSPPIMEEEDWSFPERDKGNTRSESESMLTYRKEGNEIHESLVEITRLQQDVDHLNVAIDVAFLVQAP